MSEQKKIEHVLVVRESPGIDLDAEQYRDLLHDALIVDLGEETAALIEVDSDSGRERLKLLDEALDRIKLAADGIVIATGIGSAHSTALCLIHQKLLETLARARELKVIE